MLWRPGRRGATRLDTLAYRYRYRHRAGVHLVALVLWLRESAP
ncbi:hypothetical protein [Streptomyces wuyuanensis]